MRVSRERRFGLIQISPSGTPHRIHNNSPWGFGATASYERQISGLQRWQSLQWSDRSSSGGTPREGLRGVAWMLAAWTAIGSWGAAPTGLALSVIVGLVFGVYPAAGASVSESVGVLGAE